MCPVVRRFFQEWHTCVSSVQDMDFVPVMLLETWIKNQRRHQLHGLKSESTFLPGPLEPQEPIGTKPMGLTP